MLLGQLKQASLAKSLSKGECTIDQAIKYHYWHSADGVQSWEDSETEVSACVLLLGDTPRQAIERLTHIELRSTPNYPAGRGRVVSHGIAWVEPEDTDRLWLESAIGELMQACALLMSEECAICIGARLLAGKLPSIRALEALGVSHREARRAIDSLDSLLIGYHDGLIRERMDQALVAELA